MEATLPELLIIDTLNAFFSGGDENGTQDMKGFVGMQESEEFLEILSIAAAHMTQICTASRRRQPSYPRWRSGARRRSGSGRRDR